MRLIYRLLLTFNSTFLIIVIYLIKEESYLCLLDKIEFLSISSVMYISWTLYILLPIVLTFISFLIAKYLDNDNLKEGSVVEIEMANNSYLPTYLGYFFVSLGIDSIPTLVVVYLIIYLFTFLSQSIYFNPIFLLFGYSFYFIKTQNNIKIFMITKSKLKRPGNIGFPNLKRINNYTFIDL